MTMEAMAKVERRYSRKVGESFRRDKEHLALFEELAKHDDLDSSLAAMDLIVPSEFVASAQGGNGDDVLELDGNKSEDNWLVTIPEVPLSPNIELQKLVTNTNISIRASRSIASDMDIVVPASRRNASPMRLDIESPEISSVSTSSSSRPAFSTLTKSPRSSTVHISRGSSSPRSTCTTVSSNSPRLPLMSGSPSVRRAGSATRASIVTDLKSVVTVKTSSPTFTRVSIVNSSPGRRTSTGTLCNRPLVASNAAIPSASTGGTKNFARGLSPSVRRSSPARSGTGRSPSPSVSSITSRGISPGRAGCNRVTSPSKSNNSSRRGSSPARSVNFNANRKSSPSTRHSSPATPETSSVTSTKSFPMAKMASTSESLTKPSGTFHDILPYTPANLRTYSIKRGSSCPKSIISKSYDDPSNGRRWSASSQDPDNYLSKSQDRGSGYPSGSRGLGPCRHRSRSHDKGVHRILSRNPIACEYGLDGRRVSKGSKEMSSTSPMAGHTLGRSTTFQQGPAFESSMMRRFSDPTASRLVGYNTSSSGGGFKSFMSSTSIASLDNSLCISLHHKLRQTDNQAKASSADNAELEDIIPAALKVISADGTEKKPHLFHTNTVKRIQMGFALKKEDVTTADHARAGTSEIEAHPDRTEMGSKISRLTALVNSQGPVKIYQGLGDMEDMGANWCCGMQRQYRSFCKQHECGIYKNFRDVLVVSNSTLASNCEKKAEERRTLDNENIFKDSSVAAVRESVGPTLDGRAVEVKNEAIDELPCDALNSVKPKFQHLHYQEPFLNSRKHFEDAHESKSLKSSREKKLERNSDFTVKDTVNGGAGRRKSTKESVREEVPEIIMMSPVSVCISETSDEMLQLHDQSPTSPLAVGKINNQLKSEKTEAVMKSDLVWELDNLESSSRPLKPPDFFAVTKRHGEGAAISRVQSFNASEYDTEETRSITDTRKTKTPNYLHSGDTEDHISRNDCEVVLSPKTTEVGINLVLEPRSEMEGATLKRGGQKVEFVESVQGEGSPERRGSEIDREEDKCRAPLRHGDDSNVRVLKRTPITSQIPAKLFPFVKCPQDGFGGGSSRSGGVSLVSSTKSAGSRVSSTSATSIDLTRSVDTACSAHSQYDNALWDDPNYSGRFGDPMAGIPFKSIATLPLPLPAEVRCMGSPGAVILSTREGATAPDCESQTSRSNDGFEKLSGYMRSASLNARKRRASNGLSSEGDSKMHSRESSFDYFVDFLDSQQELDLDGCGLTDVLVSAHKEAKKLENSPGANNTLRFIRRLDSRLSNNSLISDKSFESRATDMSSDSSWESGKNRALHMEGACQVMEQIVENANALSHGRHLSSFKFGQKKTTAIADLEVASESPPDSEYGPSPKKLSDATSDSSQKSAKHYDESLAQGRVLPALKPTPGIIILSEKSLDDPKFGLYSPPRTSNDIGDFDGNLWEVVQIMEEEQEMEAELAPPAPIEFAIRDFTPSRTPARTPARTPSHVSKASSNDSHHSYNSRHSHNFHHTHSSERSIVTGMTRSPSVASKASSKYLDINSDDGEMSGERVDTHRSYCGCTIL